MNNITYIMENFWEWSLQGYVDVFGFFFWPIMFSGIIGYIYLKSTSATSATVVILLLCGAFATTGIFTNVGGFVMMLQLIVTLSCVSLVVLFVSKWRS